MSKKRKFRMVIITVVTIVIILIISVTLFVNYYPAFGGSHSEPKVERFKQSVHYKDGNFINLVPTSLAMSLTKFTSIMKDYMLGIENHKPRSPLPVRAVDSLTIASKNDSLVRITWFGHSAFLVEIAAKNILLDPMFGDVPAPVSWLGSKRFTEGLPIEIEKLPQIDALIISHDHYDHLDFNSILKLKDKVGHFFVPLGVGSHLEAWGVTSDMISELNWWDEVAFEDLKLICTPARHFSGRAVFDRNTTLWASWIIMSDRHRIYFSGDSGYGPHFKDIGAKYGPFDFAMMECGQYDTRWEEIHLLPEQTARAAIDLKAQLMMPIHWGAFVLALHSWKDPVERLSKKADELDLAYIIPQIGEQLNLKNNLSINSMWWAPLE